MDAGLTPEMQQLVKTLNNSDEADRARVQGHIDAVTEEYSRAFESSQTDKERQRLLVSLALINHGSVLQGFNEHAIGLLPLFRAVGWLKILAVLNLLGLIGLAAWLYFG